jgi:hypothetical protein
MERAVAQRKKVTTADYADTWLANRHVAGRPIKPRTRAHYRALLDDHRMSTRGNRRLAQRQSSKPDQTEQADRDQAGERHYAPDRA